MSSHKNNSNYIGELLNKDLINTEKAFNNNLKFYHHNINEKESEEILLEFQKNSSNFIFNQNTLYSNSVYSIFKKRKKKNWKYSYCVKNQTRVNLLYCQSLIMISLNTLK